MGGVKNLEAKKKLNHVYSSGGGGGGTKGPAVIDKRNQELKCPYCDEIYKQKDRLTQHIARKHADQAGDGTPDGNRTGAEQPAAPAAALAAAGPSAAAAATPKAGMMDVGSRAGYYSHKSPKLQLLEWCQAQRRPKPRYRATQQEGGDFTCKVVLPDEKRSESDIVVFLAPGHAAPDADEAEQRGAVAALQRVAGDRKLDMVLPRQYVTLWQHLSESAAEGAARREAAQRSQHERAERERKRRDMDLARAPKAISMSLAQQQLVAAILAKGAAPSGSSSTQLPPEAATELIEPLVGMGFAEEAVQEALMAVPDADVSRLLDWLLIHLSPEELPQRFAGASLTNAVTLLASGSSRAARALMACGYQEAECEAALGKCEGDEEEALETLFRGLTLEVAGDAWGAAADLDADVAPAEPSVEWQEEMEVVEAIFGDAVSFLSDSAVAVDVELPQEVSSLLSKGGKAVSMMQLTFSCRAPWAALYPNVPPVIAARCEGFPAAALRHLTQELARHAAGLLGAPMVHELCTHAMEQVQEALQAAARKPARPAAPASTPQSSQEDDEVDAELAAACADVSEELEAHGGAAAAGVRQAEARPRRQRSAAEMQADSERLQEAASRWAREPGMAAIRSVRQALPAASMREQVVEAVGAHRVLVISGATGCGKSTQVPQFILEHEVAAGRGGRCNIVVTQPRRIAATGLAQRVADERGEEVGQVVGYSVRLDSKTSARTRLLFCTTGVLLRRLMGDSSLADVSHVVVDEVHERSTDTDLLLLLLRDLLASDAGRHLRVILMSATADADLFASYMEAGGVTATQPQQPAATARQQRPQRQQQRQGSAAVSTLTIPGFTHPVREFYLADILERTGVRIGRGSKYARRKLPTAITVKRQVAVAAAAPAAAPQAKPSGAAEDCGDSSEEEVEEVQLVGGNEEEVDDWETASTASTATPVQLMSSSYSEETMRSLAVVDEELIHYELIEALLVHIFREEAAHGPAALMRGWAEAEAGGRKPPAGAGGAVLIFLPGAPEISKCMRQLQSSAKLSQAVGGEDRLWLLPLHGALPPGEQSRVFRHPPQGVRKVVLATNVAETSITIDDVTVVVDTGRLKETSLDPERGITRLAETWVSQAAAQQRRGRAGRVRPGVCFRLFSRRQWDCLAAQQPPEMLRTPLAPLVLTLKALLPERRVAAVLGAAVTPPAEAAVEGAVRLLRDMSALDADEALTPLGRHLSQIPVDPRVGKALVFGAILGCLDPMLSVAAAMGYGRPAFFTPFDKRAEAEAARRQLLGPAVSSRSDHVGLVIAYNAWQAARQKGGASAGHRFCTDFFVSHQAMEAVHAGRGEYAAVLATLGFVPASLASEVRRGRALPASHEVGNANGGNWRLLKAAVCAGFYPALLRVEHPAKTYVTTAGGNFETETEPRKLKFFDATRQRVFMHPSTVNFQVGRFDSGWLVYTDLAHTSKVFCREASMAPVYSLLLFGGPLETDPGRPDVVSVGDWIQFKANARIVALVKELRLRLSMLLAAKLEDPSLDLSSSAVAQAVVQLLATDGL